MFASRKWCIRLCVCGYDYYLLCSHMLFRRLIVCSFGDVMVRQRRNTWAGAGFFVQLSFYATQINCNAIQRCAVVTTIQQLFTLSPLWPTWAPRIPPHTHTLTYTFTSQRIYSVMVKQKIFHLPAAAAVAVRFFLVCGRSLARIFIGACICIQAFVFAYSSWSKQFTSTDRLLLCEIEIFPHGPCVCFVLCQYV